MDIKAKISRVHKPVDSQKRQMDFTIFTQDSAGSHQDSRIEIAISVFLDHSHNGVNLMRLASRGQLLGTDARHRFSKGSGLLQAFEAVSRQSAFRKNNQPSSCTGSGF